MGLHPNDVHVKRFFVRFFPWTRGRGSHSAPPLSFSICSERKPRARESDSTRTFEHRQGRGGSRSNRPRRNEKSSFCFSRRFGFYQRTHHPETRFARCVQSTLTARLLEKQLSTRAFGHPCRTRASYSSGFRLIQARARRKNTI